MEAVDNGEMVLIGVDRREAHPGNYDGTTDHWVVAYGYGYDQDKDKYYILYIETAYGSHRWTIDVQGNRLYLNPESMTITGTRKNSTVSYWATQIRINN